MDNSYSMDSIDSFKRRGRKRLADKPYRIMDEDEAAKAKEQSN